jgi:hypothetical protein
MEECGASSICTHICICLPQAGIQLGVWQARLLRVRTARGKHAKLAIDGQKHHTHKQHGRAQHTEAVGATSSPFDQLSREE